MLKQQLVEALDIEPFDYLLCLAIADCCEEEGQTELGRAWRAIGSFKILPAQSEKGRRFYHTAEADNYYEERRRDIRYIAIPKRVMQSNLILWEGGWEQKSFPLSIILPALAEAMVETDSIPTRIANG